MSSDELDHPESDRPATADAGRRRMLYGLAIGGAGIAGAVVGGTATAAATSGGDANSSLTLDCACLGDTWRMNVFPNETDPGDLRGSTFNVEGLLYPGGTIPDGHGYVATADDAIGHWFCRGDFVLHAGRPEPHLMSNQEYVFGLIEPGQTFRPDMLCTVGLEGSNEDFVEMYRAVTGGAGQYRSARGECTQELIGTNSTLMAGDPSGTAAPNIRFVFDLDLPD